MTTSRRTRFHIVNTGGHDRWKGFGQFRAGSYPPPNTNEVVDGGWGL